MKVTWARMMLINLMSLSNDLTGVDETLIRKYALDFKAYIEENGLDIDIPVY